ncbi:hypothetical protein SEPCBS119000_002154 [Sporothrix epigloea]|uniref:AB hydrolase-1 domain-containing protein n=1 Tax=Sporothrix epigloea TaxID=1892477 RepID=A0ABP0DG87_9PEZI
MDSASALTTSGPSIPSTPSKSRQTHQQSRRRNIASSASAPSVTRIHSSHGNTISPASPEVISNLITSLSVISKPSDSHFDSSFDALPNLLGAVPQSPTGGSFGVDYGAFANPAETEAGNESTPLDELAASAPVIRTAKPPSGFSPLTAAKSQTRDSLTSGGLKSLLSGRSSSRPSSNGSLASRDPDTHSIGNLSIERGPASPNPDLRRQSSHDSWGKKSGRAQKGLMYMSSKERLRDKEAEKKKRNSTGGGSDRTSINSAVFSSRADPFLAEMPISEESHPDSPNKDARPSFENGASNPRPIPQRDSSLHKTNKHSTKRSSRRSSKQKVEASASNTIHELDEQRPSKSEDTSQRFDTSNMKTKSSSTKQEAQQTKNLTTFPYGSSQDSGGDNLKSGRDSDRTVRAGSGADSRRAQRPSGSQYAAEPTSGPHSTNILITETLPEDDIEDGAPFPAVAQGRRRGHSLDGRRRSRNSTDADAVKRSGSKLKRLSGPPAMDDKSLLSVIEGTRSGRTSAEDTHVVYERPDSADSIDDSVEAYLCSPRLSQKIRHPQTGRIISFSEVGDSEGSAVFCCVGMGLTRYIMAFYDELALTLKLRLITPDRPGVGDSEPYADGTATPLGWPDDVYAICQALKITKFSILAHSAGAIYALATALRMPQHIRGRIHLLAPWIPPSQMSVFGSSAQTPLPPTNAIPTSQRILRALPTTFLKAANSSFMSATSSSITSSLPKTPKKKRKSGANNPKEREKDVRKNNFTTTDNNENSPVARKTAIDASGTSPPNDFTSIEEIDRLRLHDASPGATADSSGAGRHRKSVSGASAAGTMMSAREAREAAVLAAAADAIADRERQATYDARLTHAIWDLATTGANPAVDLLVCLERRHTIGFRYVDITRPVIIHHGSRDTRVPVENVRWLGKTMRRCEVRVLEGEGHGLMASAAVMGGVLMEIAKEWEDWGRLTGSSRTRETVRDDRGHRGTIGLAR